MSNYWKSKVLPKIKKFFDKGKKKGASEVCKNFDTTKESLDKDFEDKGSDLNPKVVEIYRSSSTFITKKLLKEPNEETVKGNPDAVQSVLQELVKAGFPGAQVICDAGTKFGPALLPGPVLYLFEKASVYLVEEELPEDPNKVETREMKVVDAKPAAEAAAEGSGVEATETGEAPKVTETATAAAPEPVSTAEAETITAASVAEEKREDVPPAAMAESVSETTAAPAADSPALPAAVP